MNFDSEYKKEIDKLCDDNIKLTESEMLMLAQDASKTERNITMTKQSKKISIITRTVAAAAACIVVSGTAVYAFESGKISDMFRNFFEDDVTADLVEQGYVNEIGEALQEKDFKVEVHGMSGDYDHVMVLMDITLPEGELTENTDKIGTYSLFMTTEEFDSITDFSDIGYWYAEGIRDEENPSLYHVSVPVQPVFDSTAEEMVFTLNIVEFYKDGEYTGKETFDQFTFRFPLELDLYKSVAKTNIDNFAFQGENTTYYLYEASFDSYISELAFRFDDDGSYFASTGLNESDYCEYVENEWKELTKGMVLVVDGTEYITIPDDEIAHTIAYGNETGSYAFACFPRIDCSGAKDISVRFLGREFQIKPNMSPAPDYLIDLQFVKPEDLENRELILLFEEDIPLVNDDVTFRFTSTNYNFDSTDVFVLFNANENNELSAEAADSRAEKLWDNLVKDAVLTVDGETYSPYAAASSFYPPQPDSQDHSGSLVFPHIDFTKAQTITLTVGDVTTYLKTPTGKPVLLLFIGEPVYEAPEPDITE